MKNETILNKLISINSDLHNEALKHLIDELKLEVMGEYKGVNKSVVQAQKAALAFLKKQAKIRPVLSYTTIKEDRQLFTDGHIAFSLKTYYQLPDIKEAKDLTFPDIARLFKNVDISVREKVDFKPREVLARLKAKDFDDMSEPIAECETKKGTLYYNAKFLKDICDILGTDELEFYVIDILKPVLVLDPKTDNQALLMPVRRYN